MLFCAVLSVAAMAQNTRTVKGLVMNTDNEPLSGATVRVLGSNSVAVSSYDGKFELEAPLNAKEIEASKDGYLNSKAEIYGTYVVLKLKIGSEPKSARSEQASVTVTKVSVDEDEVEARVRAEIEGKRAEIEAKIRAEMEEEARVKAEMEARIRAELQAEAEAKIRAELEAEARAKAEAEMAAQIRAKLEAEARAKAEAEAKAKAEAEARAKAEAEARAKAEAEAKAKAEAEAKAKAEAEAKAKPEAEARAKAEAEAKAKAEAEARAKAEAEAKAKAEAEAKAKAEAEAKAKAEAEAKAKAEAAAKAKAEAAAKAKAEAEAKAKAEAEAKAKAEAEAKAKAEAEAKAKAAAEAKAKAAAEAKVKAEAEAREKAKTAAVDLGLPSGVKWGACNIGAGAPEECGDYFAWGEIDTKSNYTEFNSITRKKKIKQIAGDPNFDVATAKRGESWQIPTKEDFEELITNCGWEWATVNGVDGYKVTGPNGNSIFLPVTGYREGASLHNDGKLAEYWCSTPHKDTEFAYYFYYTGSDRLTFWIYRYVGRCVRPVKK